MVAVTGEILEDSRAERCFATTYKNFVALSAAHRCGIRWHALVLSVVRGSCLRSRLSQDDTTWESGPSRPFVSKNKTWDSACNTGSQSLDRQPDATREDQRRSENIRDGMRRLETP